MAQQFARRIDEFLPTNATVGRRGTALTALGRRTTPAFGCAKCRTLAATVSAPFRTSHHDPAFEQTVLVEPPLSARRHRMSSDDCREKLIGGEENLIGRIVARSRVALYIPLG
jgi:hypothetical protein